MRFRKDHNTAYHRIVKTIRLIAPFFDDFVLEPRGNNVILNWREKGSDQVFGLHQFSDGTLRAICLTTLLLQPENELPELIIVDEPELGLHPYALNVVAGMFAKASYHTQILISTQSTLRSLAEDKNTDVFFTTMIDLYAIHHNFPGLAKSIGIEVIRSKCPHFNSWLLKLESLGK
nr:AAA family ATPase [Dolichospermum sp. LEGE 00246]